MLHRSHAKCVRILSHSVLFALLLSITVWPLTQSHAAFTSSITPDGTLATSVAKSGSTYNINGGTIKGTNQFHSFGQFSVGTGDTASFNGPAGILNILSRVTGGQQSQIDGTIKSTIPGANLYLMNPSGVLFGPNASLNLTGSFHVTTADYLRLTDGVRFNAVPGPQDALLTTAPVAAFGFLGSSPTKIEIEGSSLSVPSGNSVSLVGGELSISGGDIEASGGVIRMAAVATTGEMAVSDLQLRSADGNQVQAVGPVTLSESKIGVTDVAGGAVLVRFLPTHFSTVVEFLSRRRIWKLMVA